MPPAGRGFFRCGEPPPGARLPTPRRGCLTSELHATVAVRRSSRSDVARRSRDSLRPFRPVGPGGHLFESVVRVEDPLHRSSAPAGRRTRVIGSRAAGPMAKHSTTRPGHVSDHVRRRLPAADPTGGRGSLSIRLPLGTISRVEGHSSALPASLRTSVHVRRRTRCRPDRGTRVARTRLSLLTVGPCHRRPFIRAPRLSSRRSERAPSARTPLTRRRACWITRSTSRLASRG